MVQPRPFFTMALASVTLSTSSFTRRRTPCWMAACSAMRRLL
jgi:hypothetical protein